MALNLSPITGPRIAPVTGAKTIAATEARDRAMKAFNDSIVTQGSPTQPGSSIVPSQQAQVTEQPTQVSDPALNSLTTEGSSTPVADSTEALATTPVAPAVETVDPKEARIAAHYANLARKEKALRERMALLRQKEAALNASQPISQTSVSPDPNQFVNKSDLINNPFGVLNDLGLSYEQLTEKALQAPSHEYLAQQRKIQELEAKIAEIGEKNTKIEKSFEETQTAAREQAERQIRADVVRLVSADPRFEVIKANRASGEVVKLITSVFDNGMGSQYPKGTVLDIEEASQMIEDVLTQQALKIAALKKIQTRIRPGNVTQQANAQKTQTNKEQISPNQKLTTLTNQIGQGTRKLSSRERAIMAFRGDKV